MRYFKALLLYIGIAVSVPAQAAKFQDLSSIAAAARTFIEGHIAGQVSGRVEINVGKLDSRLRLAKCKQDLTTFLPPGALPLKTNTVGVRCEGVKPWTIYVPVKVKLFSQVLVAAQPISRGIVIDNSLFIQAEREMRVLRRGYYQVPADVEGKEAKRAIPAGQVISPYDLTEPRIIKRGELVTIWAKAGNLSVSMNGLSLQNGRKGDMIQVRNTKTGKIVHAIVRAPNRVEVPIK